MSGVWDREEMRRLSPPDDEYCQRCGEQLHADNRRDGDGCEECADADEWERADRERDQRRDDEVAP